MTRGEDMVFTINAYKIPLESVYRLKKNNNWEPQEHFLTIDFENDMIFNTHEEAEKWLADNNILFIKRISLIIIFFL